MRSLRSRVILGTSLIALLPLAITTFVLSKRLETSVREQAEERLSSAVGGLEQQLTSTAQEIHQKLAILAQDPQLRRLYLVPSSGTRELSEYLTERRTLLGLDALQVADTTGHAVAAERRNEQSEFVPWDDRDLPTPIVYERETVGYLTGAVFLDQSFFERLKARSGVDFVLRRGSQELASTLPEGMHLPVSHGDKVTRVSSGNESFLTLSTGFAYGIPDPDINAYVSTSSSDRAIAAMKLTSLLLGLLGLGLAISLGFLWSSQISRPVEELADFSRKVAEGEWDEPLKLHSVKELETLVSALDRMRQDLKTYRERLITSERHAAWSQMARKVAHEVKNPLTPIAISVSDLKRSYEQQRPDFPEILDQAVKTIGEEVERLKHMLQEFSEFGRLPAPQFQNCRLGDIFTDLTTLYTKDVQEKRLVLSNHDPNVTLSADPSQLRQALVNLLQNGLEAVNGNGQVTIATKAEPDNIQISVSDNGPGLSPEQTQRLFSPGFTTKQTGSGLGLVMVERIVSDHQGTITVQSTPGQGTTFTVRLPRITKT